MTGAATPAPVLVVNAGSSSLKYQLVDAATGVRACQGQRRADRRAGSEARHETLDGSAASGTR